LETTPLEQADIAIIGSGPAGMQAALIAGRARKQVVVFDDTKLPRNGASHGVHNYLGFEGLLPAQIRQKAWQQIEPYPNIQLRKDPVVDIVPHENGRDSQDSGRFLVTTATGATLVTSKVLLAVGIHDVYPDVPGFNECWPDTIIHCPFCDGYENKDRTWGIVCESAKSLNKFPLMAQHWTSKIVIILSPGIQIDSAYQQKLSDLGIPIHRALINRVHHTDGKVKAVDLDNGQRVEMGTLLWQPPTQVSPLIQILVDQFHLTLNKSGFVQCDSTQRTNIEGLWAAGEVAKGSVSGIEAAAAGSVAGFSIIRSWYT
jgi:thioredoxin reductase